MTGIDIPIDLQNDVFEAHLWNTITGVVRYGRVFRTYRDDKMIPEVWISGNDYRDVLLNDAIPALSFFDVVERTGLDGAIVDIYFAVNVSTLHSSATERTTEDCLKDAVTWIQRGGIFTAVGISEGYESWKQWGMVKKEDDMHPFFLFKIRCNVKYSLFC